MPQLKKVTPIRINLEESTHAKVFELDKQIHPEEFARCKAIISTQLQSIGDAYSVLKPRYNHQTIAVLGTRGSGKTSFMLSLQKEFEEDEGVQMIDIIDPTLIEEKGHIFLTIIASISELVETKLKKEEVRCHKETLNRRREWRDTMLRLSAGLPSLDGVGRDIPDSWHDPEYVMDNGLKGVRSAKNLAVYFENFLIASLGILKKKAFLLFFDDIDVDARKGLAVLETIRKYLVSDRIITVVSGDLNLYMSVIRQRKWTNFGAEIIKYEGMYLDRMKSFNKLVTESAGQYLLKIMQPANRIHLTTFLEKKNADADRAIEIMTRKFADGVDIKQMYRAIFVWFGIRNLAQLEVYVTFLLGLPVRTQLHLLISIGELKVTSQKISDVFIADLMEREVNIGLANQSPKYLSSVTLSLLLRERMLLELYQLQPTSPDDSTNGAIFALGLLFSLNIRRRYSFLIFEYFIKIAYVRNLKTILSYREEQEVESISHLPSIEEMCELCDVFNDGVLRDVTGAIQSYLLGAIEFSGNKSSIAPFFTQLYQLNGNGNIKDRIDTVFAGATKAEYILGLLPAYKSAYTHRSGSKIMYSVYVLLATVGEIIRRYETVADSVTAIQIMLRLLSQLRTYSVPDFRENNSRSSSLPVEETGDYEDMLDQGEGDISDDSDMELASRIKDWMDRTEMRGISPHLLGKVFTRFYYTMNNISDALRGKDIMPLGELFSHQVVAFLNAALVEDATEHTPEIVLKIDNTRLNDKMFIDNLKTVIDLAKSRKDRLFLSRWLLSCPLLLPYLRKGSFDTIKELLIQFCEESFIDAKSFELSVADKLDAVRIMRQGNSIEWDQILQKRSDLLNDYVSLIDFLKQEGAKRIWFEGGDSYQIQSRNKRIKDKFPGVFGRGISGNDEIQKFRDFLSLNPEIWQ